MNNQQTIQELYQLIAERKKNPIEKSYTNYLFDKGTDKILKKIGEESTEVIVAAKNTSRSEFNLEVADLTYHLLVLLVQQDISLAEIETELGSRTNKMSKTSERKSIEDL